MAVVLQELHDEIENDPDGYGYKEVDGITWKGDQVIADLLNLTRATIQLKRSDIQADEVFHAIAVADLVNNPGASDLQWFNSLLTPGRKIRLLNDDGTDTPVRSNVLGLVKGSTATLTRLAALETRDAARSEELWGGNIFVTAGDVGRAANL